MARRIADYIQREDVPPLPPAMRDLGMEKAWLTKVSRDRTCWDWFDGRVWAKKDDEGNPHFPVSYNPLRIAAWLHTGALFGEPEDTADPMVRISIIEEDDQDPDDEVLTAERKTQQQHYRRLSRFVNRVIEQSHGRSLFYNAGVTSYALGGAVIKVRFAPDDPFLRYPIKLERVATETFFPVYERGDMWHLLEAYIIRYVDKTVAKAAYNVTVKNQQGIYIEHWTRTSCDITIDGKPAQRQLSTGDWMDLSGPHPYQVVPVVYIPSMREGDEFWGVPLVHQVEGTLEEINGRIADIGDAVRDSAIQSYVRTNFSQQKRIRVEKVAGLRMIDGGQTPPGSAHKPEIDLIDPPKVQQASQEFVNSLDEKFNRLAFIPSIAWGKDEGSQRSALTLAFRMWMLAKREHIARGNWTVGLSVLTEIIFRVAERRKSDSVALKELNITEADFNLRKRIKWAPMLPRDLETMINTTILKHQEGIMSTEQAVRTAGDVENVEEELKKIEGDLKKKTELEATPAGMNGKGGALSDKQPPVARVESD